MKREFGAAAAGLVVGLVSGLLAIERSSGNFEEDTRVFFADLVGLHAREGSPHVRELVELYLQVPVTAEDQWKDDVAVLLFAFRSQLEGPNSELADFFETEAIRRCQLHAEPGVCSSVEEKFTECRKALAKGDAPPMTSSAAGEGKDDAKTKEDGEANADEEK